ncbi:FAD-binding oxidoreductase [Amycolatopsis rhizosphaerae]|uniref:FAD-binding oxidoreductase n=1 Tax=Amycolatopsis rhizosphaerae TaxID=2053003 RepID=A0A558BWS9_9PSEU|nr:FAD-binding and (Fe-S)-binding domain-containing protein [Amycolatopsis rhizosphaerae]TVT40959.1 FAD-binding oxidoreductase [Amycolatopsis rhizosphaerae]
MTATADEERVARFLAELGHALAGEVEHGTTARATYSMDASNYRQVPVAVVHPRTVEDLETTVRLCRRYRIPITPRGAGTSIGGQALGRGVVLDYTRHLNQILEIDPAARTARVRPGVVLDRLREAAAWGRTADNVVALEVLTADGTRMTIGPDTAADPGPAGRMHQRLRQLALDNLAVLRTGFPSLPRRVSGYALDQLLPENGTNLVRALVGTEGTCVLLTEITVRLVPAPAARALVVAGYEDDIAAADAVPSVLSLKPLTVEGMGADLVEALQARRAHPAVDLLPKGRGWLFVEVGGASAEQARQRAEELSAVLRDRTGADTVVETEPADQRLLWSVRESAAGIVTRMADGTEAWPGWEDSAVPPENLGAYLRDFRALLARHGLKGVPYGHFGEGCVHIRIDFALTDEEGRRRFRAFLEEAADLVVRHGGSLSGEHGDGQARAELLPRMYPPAILDLFARFKGIWDPENLFNPGNLVHPRPLDADLRFDGPVRSLPVTLRYPHDGGSLAVAARRCVGVGACIDTSTGVMCPSYMVTRREEHSTRGRAHLLFEMMRGETVTEGWRSQEVLQALDLCLSCKGCLSDCPVNVDMASYKAEFLHQHYAGRLRPASHYSLGFLPLLARLASAAPRLANAVLGGRTAPLVKKLGGITPERSLPRFAPRSFRRSFRPRPGSDRPKVLLWPDTFTNFLSPEVGVDAVKVLEHAGFDVVLPSSSVCCGLTWISTGQLDIARRMLRRTVRVLRPALDKGVPIVGLEPSCLAVFRHDARELLGDDELNGLPGKAFGLAEFLERFAPDVEFPRLPAKAITQEHCHQHATTGNAADERLLRKVGVDNRTLDSGCCGLAGNFGVEKGHYEVSVGAANRVLVPEVEAAAPDTLVLADGFSCRTQIADLTERRALHLAQVLASALEHAEER